MVSKYLIYGLVDPRTHELRYIGKSCNGLKRPQCHTQPTYLKRKSKNYTWLRKIVGLGLKPEIIVLEEFETPDRLSEAEQEWIVAAQLAWVRLTNETAGGAGAHGRVLSERTKTLISQKRKGQKHSEEARVKMSQSRKGLSFSAEHTENLWLSRWGRHPFVDDTGRVWEKKTDAAKFWNITPGNVHAVLSGLQKTTGGGRTFKYIEPENVR